MLAAILRLPAEERARLALELIRSLDAEVDPPALGTSPVDPANYNNQ